MKWFPLVILLSVISCVDTPRRYNDTLPLTVKLEKFQEPEKSQKTESGTGASRSMTHLAPKIKIDTERQEIEITGHSGQGCGINFLDGQVLRYQLLSDSELEIMMEAETLKLSRIHRNDLTGIYGDWQSVDFKEETATNRERIVTIFIRESEIMNVDVYCEQRYGKLIEEF